MVDVFDTRRAAYLDKSAKTQLCAAYDRQTILRYFTDYGVNEKNQKQKIYIPDRKLWSMPTLCSIATGLANFRGYLANHYG